MNIVTFDAARHTDAILHMLQGKDHLTQSFQQAAASAKDVIYVAEDAAEVTGFLLLQEFSRRSVHPTVFVREDKRRMGIGTTLSRALDGRMEDSAYEFSERQVDAEAGTAAFLQQNGYTRYYTEVMMQRDNTPVDPEQTSDEALTRRGLLIRNYRDEDYWAYHNIVGVGFYLMREHVGMLRWYSPPSQYERKELAEGYRNRYVLVENGEVIAVSKINGSDISLLGVRPDKQGQGYGTLLLGYWINRILREQQPPVITIDTTQGNPAQRLYQRMGFRQTGERYGYIKFYKPDSRPKGPQGYGSEQEILDAFRRHGTLREEMVP